MNFSRITLGFRNSLACEAGHVRETDDEGKSRRSPCRSPMTDELPLSRKFLQGRLFFADGVWHFRRRAPDRLVSITAMMRECCFDACRLRALLGMGEKSFYRLVTECLNVTPNYWLRSERMVHARALLREGGIIKQVATATGFPHKSSFEREFRSWYGVTPAEFRRREATKRLLPE